MRFCDWLTAMKLKTGVTYKVLSNVTGANEVNVRNHAIGKCLPRDYMMEAYFDFFQVPTNKWDSMRLRFKQNEKRYRGKR